MTRRGAICTFIALVMLAWAAGSANAGPTYSVKLPSGTVYKLEMVSAGHFDVKNAAGTQVGSIQGQGSSYQAFDVNGKSLGTATKINPDAITLIDAHVNGGL